MKYKDPTDSVSLDYNFIDESYIPLHEHKLVAGSNFRSDLIRRDAEITAYRKQAYPDLDEYRRIHKSDRRRTDA